MRSGKRPLNGVHKLEVEGMPVSTKTEKPNHSNRIEKPMQVTTGEKLCVKSEKEPSNRIEVTDDDNERFVSERKISKVKKPSEKSVAVSSMAERLRERPRKTPTYKVDDSDDEDQVPCAQKSRRERKLQDDLILKSSSLDKELHIVDDLNDEDLVPIGQLSKKCKEFDPSEKSKKPMQDNLNSMTCYSGSRVVRSGKRPLYNEDELDDEVEALIKPKNRKLKLESTPKKIIRNDLKPDACQVCGESGDLIGCGTCPYTFHHTCLFPPQKATLCKSWSCSECVNPLNEIEKILDSKLQPIAILKTEESKHYVRHYLVKWKGFSYLHCSWITEDEFSKAFKSYPGLKTRLNNFKAKMNSVDTLEDEFTAIRPAWTTVDKIIASRKTGNKREYFVKWKELGYDECTWEVESDITAFKPQINRFHVIHSCRNNQSSGKDKNYKGTKGSKDNHKDFHQYDQTPEFLSGTLHPYQLEGLNFLRYSWSKRTHVILADEMGLGKTIQSIAFLASLCDENRSPHLVIAPLSTLRNWEREFSTWAPEMNVVMYCGSASARAIARQYEFFCPKEEAKKNKKRKAFMNANKSSQRRIKFNVLLTSYEMINQDATSLKNIQWECLIVDEGHRLKNKDSKLFLQLKLFSTKQRVLLTGTPLQNNLDELFMLMHFLDDEKFSSVEDFQKEFSDISQEEQVDRLHKMLAPHLLRRVKKDVMKELPAKKELILRVELSNKQKEYYKAILTRNYDILVRRGGAQISLINVAMELRKLCCHVYMLEGMEPVEEPSDANEGLRQLLESSGKMQLLDKMMVKLKEEGHRVLIYSQFQYMLDLLEDYLTYRKWSYERIDGKVSGAERQTRIDRFNADNSTRFCFLLSTRAGGIGINLATADTVIIYDSDWNPHADLQAMARAHRLGQVNKVMIYRLITRGTIEERMMQLTKKKMVLEHLVVGRLKAEKNVNQEELDDIIRYGSKELFADENEDAGKARQIHYDNHAIERLLDRDQIVGEEASVSDEDDDFLKAFKVANFEYIDEVEAAASNESVMKQSMTDKDASSSDKASYWEGLLKDKYQVHQAESLNALGKGKRSRRQLNNDHKQGVNCENEAYNESHASESETSSSGDSTGNRVSRNEPRGNNVIDAGDLPLMEGEGKSLKILGFSKHQRQVFMQTLMRFGWGDCNWKEFIPRFTGKTPEEVQEYGFLFLKHLNEGINDSLTYSDGVPKEGIHIEDILVRQAQISLIREKLNFLNENSGASLFPDDIKENQPSLIGKFWKEEHDILLLKAIIKHGYARWQSIADDRELGLLDVICQELYLPFVNRQPEASANSNQSANGLSVTAKGNSSNPSNLAPDHLRKVEKCVNEFIRKRYHLLEKLLDLELCLEEDEKATLWEHGSEIANIEQPGTGVSNSTKANTNSILRELPILEPIDPLMVPNEEEDVQNAKGIMDESSIGVKL